MAPTTRASRKIKVQTVANKADKVEAENTKAKNIHSSKANADKANATKGNITKDHIISVNNVTEETDQTIEAVQDKAEDKTKQKPDNTPDDNSDPLASMTYEEMDWLFWYNDIEEAALASASDPRKVFIDGRHLTHQDPQLFFYTLNGALFVARDNGVQPWRWPMVQVDPATLGLPYNPATNADDAAMGLTVAIDHEHLYKDMVYIKDLFHPVAPQPERWAAEVRMYEMLSKQHPHPNIARYLGCRVIEVPDGSTVQTKTKTKRITGIVLEHVDRCLAEYNADAPAFRDLDVDLVLQRLEATILFLHSIGLAHNDIKPANVLVRTDGQPVLIDFESCAPLGAPTPCQGTAGWCESVNMTSRVENDLYALQKIRERIGDKEAVAQWFRAKCVVHLS